MIKTNKKHRKVQKCSCYAKYPRLIQISIDISRFPCYELVFVLLIVISLRFVLCKGQYVCCCLWFVILIYLNIYHYKYNI